MFYKEIDFRDSPIGKIPKEWEVDTLPNLMNIIDYRGRTPPFSESGIPYIGSDNIRCERIVFDNKRYVSDDTYRKYMTRGIPDPGDILFTTEAPLGEAALIPDNFRFCFAQRLMALKPKHNYDSPYFMYMLRSKIVQRQLRGWATGTTVKGISSKNMKFINIPYSKNIEEQREIAEILSCADLAIQKIAEVIAKTERLKKGLMQQLLTRGIGHKEFKGTEIGKIPRLWKAAKLEDVVEINKESRDPSREMPEQNFLYVDIDSVEGGTGKIRDSKTVLGIKAPSRARRVIHENDVIMSTVRPYLKAFAIVPKEYEDQICSTGFAVLSSRNKILPYFLLSILFSDQTINQCNRMMMGGQYPALNRSQVSRIKIPLPPLSEQQRIAEIFLTLDGKLELEKQEKEKLERVKQALMALLLSGKVRVRVD